MFHAKMLANGVRSDQIFEAPVPLYRLRIRAKVDRPQASFILLFVQLFVFDAIGFVAQIPTTETMCASGAIVEERAVAAVIRECDMRATIVMIGIQSFVAKFRVHHLIAISEVARSEYPVSIINIFRPPADADAEIAVFKTVAVIAVLAVFRILDDERHAGNLLLQLRELLQKRLREIDVLPVRRPFPGIRPPARRAVHGERRIGMVDGDDGFTAEITGSSSESALIAPCEMSLDAALWTQCRRWNQLLLAFKYRRNFLVEGEVGVGDGEGGRALEAGTLH